MTWRARPLAAPELGEQSVALYLTFDAPLSGGEAVYLVWRRDTTIAWVVMTNVLKIFGVRLEPERREAPNLDELLGIAHQADHRLVAVRDR